MTAEKRPPAGAAVLRGEITTAIRRALMQELAAAGYGRLSIEAVARRAGVSKTAIYRRWSSKLDLVLDVVSAVAGRKLPLLDTGTLDGDVRLLLLVVTGALGHPLASQIIPDLLAEAARNPQIAGTLQGALNDYQERIGEIVVGRAVERGELPAGADPRAAADLIVGPVYWRLAIARVPLEPAELPRMAEAAVAALRVACAESDTAVRSSQR
ncbi:DNA-binding transcriptional regulator, AcrR family [Micromonospora phaseoli]|uniref:DNA-binding transcriptional regulator, AcrR family n=1 Tax=Micromonospora phaseoli TaxID=1144548 RepID=A0A1H6SNS6_9ACTN|nr:TetR/AcrR family transcriptional regulator [Micromonospora phaseoli]PZW03886.1 TetR family transcriptional regulator [Micromonospora phaseoli]GIJ77700.1 TetR family transcriptional regulator [Micromonospora phaseoli]SEI65252.1 DNA-binding transcriptional regulator, AcrR family [Micromonospora phaseoli]